MCFSLFAALRWSPRPRPIPCVRAGRLGGAGGGAGGGEGADGGGEGCGEGGGGVAGEDMGGREQPFS